MNTGSISSLFQSGGFIMYVLTALSIIGLGVALERLKNLQSERLVSKNLMKDARRLWLESRFEALESLTKRHNCIMSRVISVVLQHRDKRFEVVSTVASDTASSAIKRQLHLIYPLSIIATISPLLGLLGTIVGLIRSFQMIAITGISGDASIVADGISQALVTTAAGLMVGISALGLYHYFKNRIARYSGSIEENANAILFDWLLGEKGEDAH